MIKVDVFIQEKKWKKYIVNPQKYLENKANKITNSLSFLKNKKVVFSVLLTGSKDIKNLNKKFIKKKQNYRCVILSLLSKEGVKKKNKKK